MESFTKGVYRQVLQTHDLTTEDINYGVEVLSESDLDLPLILHLNKNEYIGALSKKFNEDIDENIKERSLDQYIKSIDQRNLWSEVTSNVALNKEEILMLTQLENIYLVALSNCLNFASLDFSDELFDHKGLYNFCLENSFSEIECLMKRPEMILSVPLDTEVGAVLRIKKTKYVHLIDLLEKISQGEFQHLKDKYQKELIINSYK